MAQKLSSDFAVWVDTKLEELLTTGVTTLTNDDEVIAQAMNVLQKRLDASKQKVQMLESENEVYKGEIKQLAPKAAYTDEVLQSTSTFTFTQVSKSMGLRSVCVLLDFLKEKGVIFRQSGQWLPIAKYADKGYFKTRTSRYFHKDGAPDTSLSTVITEYGRVFIWNLLSKHGMLKNNSQSFETAISGNEVKGVAV